MPTMTFIIPVKINGKQRQISMNDTDKAFSKKSSFSTSTLSSVIPFSNIHWTHSSSTRQETELIEESLATLLHRVVGAKANRDIGREPAMLAPWVPLLWRFTLLETN